VTKHLLTEDATSQLTQREVSLSHHEAFIGNWSHLYVGGEKYLAKLDKFLVDGESSSLKRTLSVALSVLVGKTLPRVISQEKSLIKKREHCYSHLYH